MNFDLTDDQITLRDSIRRFMKAEVLPLIKQHEAASEAGLELRVIEKRPDGEKELCNEHRTVVRTIVALVAGVLGFGGIAIISVEIARLLFFVFLVLFAVSLIAGLLRGRPTL
mgnify:CR=1 FL=1